MQGHQTKPYTVYTYKHFLYNTLKLLLNNYIYFDINLKLFFGTFSTFLL